MKKFRVDDFGAGCFATIAIVAGISMMIVGVWGLTWSS